MGDDSATIVHASKLSLYHDRKLHETEELIAHVGNREQSFSVPKLVDARYNEEGGSTFRASFLGKTKRRFSEPSRSFGGY